LAAHREALRAIDVNSKTYSNVFSYSDEDIEEYLAGLVDIEEAVRSCQDLGRISDHVAERLRRDRLAATAVMARHDPEYSAAQRDLHGSPSEELVCQAKQSLDTSTSGHVAKEKGGVTTAGLAQRMTDVLRSYGLTDWYVQVEENMTAKASVNGSLRRVRLRGNEVFSAFDADRLMVHEIGGHVLRWANSRRQPEPWAKVPMGQTIPTEEGLAVCRESEFGLLDQKNVRKYQVRCLAVSIAAHSGIMDVIRAISPYVDRDEAVEIAIRTKRGLLDPNAPGGATKDWGYYDGYLRMRSLRESSPSDYQLLCGVKWPEEDLPLIKDLCAEGHIVEPVLVPDPVRLGLKEHVEYDEDDLRTSN